MLIKNYATQSHPSKNFAGEGMPHKLAPIFSQAVLFKFRKNNFAEEVKRNNDYMKNNLARISSKSRNRYLGEFSESAKEPNWARKISLWSQKKNEIRQREIQKQNLQILNHLSAVKAKVL